MVSATDFSSHSNVLLLVEQAQDAEQDQREQVREAKKFLTLKDGMWDQDSWTKMDGRYRGTFDMCTPIVDGIAGEIDQADFSLRVSPSGGRASKDTAKTLDGLLRNIRNISNAEDVFNKMARSNVVGGFDCLELTTAFIDGDSFDQDILINRVPDAVDSVWFDLASVEQDRSDAKWGIKQVAIPLADYKERWPDGGQVSLGDNAVRKQNKDVKDVVVVGQLYYRKPVTIELVMMTDGSVYRDDDDFQAVKDELAIPTQQNPNGIAIALDGEGEEKRRTRDSWRVWSRMLDGGGWLDDEEETVFDYVPLVPIYGNFDIIENECIYFGKIKNLLDPQRTFNYAASRDIEDGALSPSPFIWMTDKQAEDNDYSQMNTDHAPIRIYNPDSEAPGAPQQVGGPVQSSGLQTTMANMQQMISASSNTFDAQQGNASSTQSGIAGLQQIEQGNIGSIKWFKALEITICQVGRVIISGAASRVYDGDRQVRVLGEDGTSEIVPINKKVFDDDQKKNIVLNDLSIGEYDVVCEMGPAFNSAQKEAARAFEAVMSVNPELAARNMDIWLKNKKEPGFDLMAERERVQLFNAGVIPEDQWTDEESAQVAEQQAQAAQQPAQEDPAIVEARGIELSGQADVLNAQTKQQESQFNAQVKAAEVQLEQDKVALEREKLQLDVAKFQREKDDKFNVDAAKINQGQQVIDQKNQQMVINAQQNQDKIDLQAQDQRFNQIVKTQEAQQEVQSAIMAEIKSNAESFKIMAEAMQTFVGPGIIEAGINQADVIQESQEKAGVSDDVTLIAKVDTEQVEPEE